MGRGIEPTPRRVRWQRYYRLASSAFPPIDLFDDIADPVDWPLLAKGEGRTNPRLDTSIGNLDLVPPERRVGGKGASYVMAPFVHVSPDRPGRFHDGTFGTFYAANEFDTAVIETAHHRGVFYTRTETKPGWLCTLRELIGSLDSLLVDICGPGFDTLLHPTNYSDSQAFARAQRRLDRNGILYPSVRHEPGKCIAAFHPDVVGIPVQGRHLDYHWNGERIDLVRDRAEDNAVFRIES